MSRSKISRLNFHPFYEGFLRISHKVTQVRAFPIKTLMMSKSALALGPDHESQSKSRIFYYLLLHAFLVCHHLNSPSPLSHDSGWRKVVCIKIAVMAAFNIWPLAMAKNIVTFKPKCIKPLPWKESNLGTPLHQCIRSTYLLCQQCDIKSDLCSEKSTLQLLLVVEVLSYCNLHRM